VSAHEQAFFNTLTIVAILLGPIFAIQIQVYLDHRREQKRRKLGIFRDLMVTRGTALSPRQVEALNGIQMEFSAKNPEERQVTDAWQNYMNHLNNFADTDAWRAQSPELLSDLLLQMAICLGYTDFNKARIKAEAYVPRYFGEIESEQNELRKAAIQVFKGNQPLSVRPAQEVTATPRMGSELLCPPLRNPRDDDN
jgi:hypothetical protein